MLIRVLACSEECPLLVAGLNPEVALDDLAEDIAEIGYPVAPGGER